MATSTITIISGASTVTLDNTVSTITLGTSGPQGAPGEGVPVGGTAGQILAKDTATDYDTSWIDNYTTDVRKYIKNDSGSTLTKGTVVYVSGANGTNVLVKPAIATTDGTSATTIGFLNETLANNGQGYAIVEGTISGIDTSAATAGDPVWLSGAVAGGVLYGVANKPQAPVHIVYLGTVTRAHATQGSIEISVNNGWELDELHNVKITSPANGQVLTYDSATQLWVNSSETGDISAVTVSSPITGGGTSGSVNIGIDQTAITLAQSQVTNLTTDLAGKAALGSANAFTVGGHTITNAAIGTVPLRVIGASGQTANVFQIERSTGARAVFDSSGNLATLDRITLSNTTAVVSTAARLVTQTFANQVGVIVQGAASQTANLQEWQNSSGGVNTQIGPDGTLSLRTNSSLNPSILVGTTSWLGAEINVQPYSATRIGAIIRGAASQTANLQEWQNSAGSILGSISSAATATFAEVRINTTNNAALRPLWGGNGGVLQLRKGTASTVPGATDYLQLGVVDGTTAGTLKLVVRAGTTGAQTTILDNIPQ